MCENSADIVRTRLATLAACDMLRLRKEEIESCLQLVG